MTTVRTEPVRRLTTAAHPTATNETCERGSTSAAPTSTELKRDRSDVADHLVMHRIIRIRRQRLVAHGVSHLSRHDISTDDAPVSPVDATFITDIPTANSHKREAGVNRDQSTAPPFLAGPRLPGRVSTIIVSPPANGAANSND